MNEAVVKNRWRRSVRDESFRCELSLAEVRARWNELGPWRWVERWSAHWGTYISATVLAAPDWGAVRVVEEARGFACAVWLESDAADPFGRFLHVHETVFERLLPAIGADLIEHDDGDRRWNAADARRDELVSRKERRW